MRTWTLIMALLLTAGPPQPASAHGGGLNAEGCHSNRKTGDYHCHRSTPLPTGSIRRPDGGTSSGAFSNCAAARAVGAAPIRYGDPGYGRHLDRDGDGIGCE